MGRRREIPKRRGKPAPPRGPAYDPDEPTAGFYSTRFVKDGPPVALRIWFGFPVDPVTGEEMDRAPRWLCQINGTQIVEAERFWPGCARDPMTEATYNHVVELSRSMDPADPYFDPLRKIDRLKIPNPF